MKNLIKEYRIKKGKTQQQLANEVGITRPYLSYIENNKKQPGSVIAIKIAKALDVPMENLFFNQTVNQGNHNKTA